MANPITNSADLRAEILRLKMQKTAQETELRQHISTPKALFSSVGSLFHRPKPHIEGQSDGFNISAWLSRILPHTLDRTLFRKSNFVVRGLIRMISRNVVQHADKQAVTGLWDKIKNALPGLGIRKDNDKTGYKKLNSR